MTAQPRNKASVKDLEEDEEGAFERMPFEVAHALARLGWHESWNATLARVESKLDCEKLPGGSSVFDKYRSSHKRLVKEARQTWNILANKWAAEPRGAKEGAEVVKAFQDLAKATGEHCAAMRIFKIDGKTTSMRKLQSDADEPYERVESSRECLKSKRGVLRRVLCEHAVDLLWATGWHVANTFTEYTEEMDDEQEENEEECDDDDDAEEEDDEEEEEDEEAAFGEEYPGSSDDYIEDVECLLEKLTTCFCEQNQWRGVRLDLSSSTALEVESVLEKIAHVPGVFEEPGLNAARLLLPDLSGAKDPLSEDIRSVLAKAEAVGLSVLLELPARPGQKYEAWLRSLAATTASLGCIRGIALPLVEEPQKANGLLHALRDGGLTQSKCACFFQVSGIQTIDSDGEWTEQYTEALKTKLGEDPTQLPWWLADGHALLEAPAAIPPGDEFTEAQNILDAASELGENCQHLSLVSSWNLKVPPTAQGTKAKTNSSQPGPEFYLEYSQRLLASVQQATRGWFFEAWQAPTGDESGEHSLENCLEQKWVDLSADVQVMYAHGSSHKATLVYLHGFTCDGYSYLLEPHHFYRVKPKKKKGLAASKKKKQDAGEDEEKEYEPHPGLKVLLPSACKRRITCYQGEMLDSWHDYITDYEGEQEDEISQEDLEEVTRRLHCILDKEAALVGGKNVFLGGASQGCGVALHCALTYPGELGGVMGCMGHLLTCTPVTPEWVARKIPIFTYNGLADSCMNWEKWVKATYSRLEDAGADIRIVTEEGVDHAEQEDEWVRAFLTEALRPASVKTVTKKTASKKK